MLRKNIRLRKEYLYRKGLEHEDKSKAEKKRKIREAFENSERIPSELRLEEAALRKEIELIECNAEKRFRSRLKHDSIGPK